ncbi:cyclic diguanylate phosphodiesterase [Planctomycetales bacterium]|nr:cyclic diguanylate phosphodiesterase [Planctomycetales bacterium]GHS99318.1 cyclic diguanylate phosphodiesterase [Planctomycetales bacterium]GHT02464.1 cyclic diguanylate phosphodiesterase [Planctomycetales bacterium]GHV23308.1 cyclic diguanylate phosphodiesterase [Planctomycetales bacterium]
MATSEPPPTDPTREVYIARQPILDRRGNLYAYELLFRSGAASRAANVVDATAATSQVLCNSATVGMDKLVGRHKAFVNCNRDVLLKDFVGLLDPKTFVLEILEDVEIDAAVVAAVERLHAKGYIIALDDFVFNREEITRAQLVMGHIALIKIDLSLCPRETWAPAAKFIKQNHKVALAEKVETEADFIACQAAGYDLFQGYFFAKPEMLSAGEINTKAMSVISLLQAIRANPEVANVTRELKSAADLTVQMLQFINSAAMGLRNPISSIQHAVTMFGLKNLERWLMLMLYAQNTAGGDPQNSPLFDNVTQRAKMMEGLAKSVAPANRALHDKAYLTGVMSRIDALFQIPLERIVSEFKLDDDIGAAVLRGEGELGQMLQLTAAHETENFAEVARLAGELSITDAQFNQIVAASYMTDNLLSGDKSN